MTQVCSVDRSLTGMYKSMCMRYYYRNDHAKPIPPTTIRGQLGEKNPEFLQGDWLAWTYQAAYLWLEKKENKSLNEKKLKEKQKERKKG